MSPGPGGPAAAMARQQQAGQIFAEAVRQHQAGALDAAIALYRRAIALKPDFPNALYNLGLVLQHLQRMEEAASCYRSAIRFKPAMAEAHYNLGLIALGGALLDEAVAAFRRAVAARPGYAEAQYNLGIALRQQGQVEQAVACYRTAIAARPDYADAHYNLGIAWQDLRQADQAAASYRAAIAIQPGYTDAHYNLGLLAQRHGWLQEAASSYRRAIACRPDHADAHTCLATTLLTQGELAEGWVEYEWRWHASPVASERRAFAQPQWRGEPASGQTLLVHAEQGFGDTLQFCRFAPLAAARGLRVILEVQAPLVRLLRGLPGIDRVVAQGEELPPFDLHCLTQSLPLALGITMQSIPSARQYLHADAAQQAAWASRLAATGAPGLRVGLAWAGSPTKVDDDERSLTLERFEGLRAIPGLQLFSLQKDGRPATGLIDVMGEMADFADTAALVANLDLVVAVDTAVAHLAAALGRPVWMLNRLNTDWRWFAVRPDSPWYPTLRLFRQRTLGDWDPVLHEVVAALRAWADRRGGQAMAAPMS